MSNCEDELLKSEDALRMECWALSALRKALVSGSKYSLGWQHSTPTRESIVRFSNSFAASWVIERSDSRNARPHNRCRCCPEPKSRASKCHTCDHICASFRRMAQTLDKLLGPITSFSFFWDDWADCLGSLGPVGLVASGSTFSNWNTLTLGFAARCFAMALKTPPVRKLPWQGTRATKEDKWEPMPAKAAKETMFATHLSLVSESISIYIYYSNCSNYILYMII